MFNFSTQHTLGAFNQELNNVSFDYTQRFIDYFSGTAEEHNEIGLRERIDEIEPKFIIQPIPDATRNGLDIQVKLRTNTAVNTDPDTGLDAHIHRLANVYIAAIIRPELCPSVHRWGQDHPDEVQKIRHSTATDPLR